MASKNDSTALREGQKAFNFLHATHPGIANEISGGPFDPFEDDSRLEEFHREVMRLADLSLPSSTAPRPALADRLLPLAERAYRTVQTVDTWKAADAIHEIIEILREPGPDAGKAEPMTEAVELAWGLIANAHGGDWDKATEEWQQAAERWRDSYAGAPANAGDETERLEHPLAEWRREQRALNEAERRRSAD